MINNKNNNHHCHMKPPDTLTGKIELFSAIIRRDQVRVCTHIFSSYI